MSAQINKIDREKAKTSPETCFKEPADVLKEPGLTRGEKVSALENWSHLVNRRLESGSEGMPTYGTEPRDAELMRQIELAKQELASSASA